VVGSVKPTRKVRRVRGGPVLAVALAVGVLASSAAAAGKQDKPPAATPASSNPTLTIPRLAGEPTLEDFLRMEPGSEAARQMARVTDFTQRNPHDGERGSERTEAYLGYDQKNLYVVFVCFDEPSQVRARMSVREDIFDDDQVEIILDTYHDRRRAYAFQTSPLGVQWDAIWTEASRDEQTGGHYDVSFDTVWNSRGKVTDRGFVVWIQIPFKSLRFPAQQKQEWGIILSRSMVRKTEDDFWPHVSYRAQGYLGVAATLQGLEGISPGRDIELIPYGLMRGFRALDTRDPENPYFQKAQVQGQPGMDAKFVFHDHFTIDATANPDFSQVESEDPQITVNQRYAVYFPEKRPFFLENEDIFRTPMDLLFTRSIGDPSAGIRLTGKDGPYSVGLLATDDRSPGLAVPNYCPPTSNDCSSEFSGTRSYFSIGRVSRDLFGQSSVGLLYTDWECPATGEFNRIGGVDTRVKFNPNWSLDGQAVESSSYLNLNCEANIYPFSTGNQGNGSYFAGPAEKLDLRRDGLHLTYEGTYSDITAGFVTIPGFINRVDIRETTQEVDYRFRPKKGWIVDWGPSALMRYDFDHTGLRLDTYYTSALALQGRGQTVFFLWPYTEKRERLRPEDQCYLNALYCTPALPGVQDYHEHLSGGQFQTAYLKWATVGASYNWGDGVNFTALPTTAPATPQPYNFPFLARQDNGTAFLTVRPIAPLKIENTYLYERLRTTESTYLQVARQTPGTGRGIFSDHIIRSKWNWQFTPQLSLRVILQYNALLAGTPVAGTPYVTLSPYTDLLTAREFNADLLVTYLVHPGTAIYVGYNSDMQNLNVAQRTATEPGYVTNSAKGYLNDSRQFFVKVSYMFRF
jgi:Domain of unknown function (DUF5916)/Carbohydrate family 9 binding domain-like